VNINLHIDHIVLEGLDISWRERSLLQTAVETELARLIGENGLEPGLLSSGSLAAVAGGSVQLSEQPDPIALGRQIAQAVYGGVRR
jgi:hypothetical protein